MKKLGFGFMRLPMLEDRKVDIEHTQKMVDAFMEGGFRYFDTAHPYLKGESEKILKICLSDKYPRESFVLTDKLSSNTFETEEQIRPMIEEELAACGVEYFDYLLMHALNASYYEKYTRTRAFEIAQELKAEGKIRHIGMSFHDTPEVLDQILSEHPELEVVQIQFNYLDVENPNVQSMDCYEVVRKHGRQVLIMEPVKGGALANLPEEAAKILDELCGGSHASYAIRYAASQEGVLAVLSGMSTLEQVQDNMSYMTEFVPLNEAEQAALEQVRQVILAQKTIGCTACRYCMDVCPQQIPIPEVFNVYNRKQKYLDPGWRYGAVTKDKKKASDCLECGACEEACPQKLEIRALLKKVAETFE